MAELPIDRCSTCGREIIWARTIDGKAIPLDARAPVYQITVHPPYQATRPYRTYVSHFSTCPNATAHSKKRSRADELPGI